MPHDLSTGEVTSLPSGNNLSGEKEKNEKIESSTEIGDKSGHVAALCLDQGQAEATFINQTATWERQSPSELLGTGRVFSESTMRAALSSFSCSSCLKRSPEEHRAVEETGVEVREDPNGIALPLQPTGRPSDPSTVDGVFGMSEGDVTVLPFGPASQDLPWKEQRTLTRLYCKNGGYHLRISAEGKVSGGRQENDQYDILRLKAVSVGVVAIKGEHTGRYLAMDKEGHLYGSQTLNDECHFHEKYEENHYNTYRSQKYGWYMGLKKNGQPKPGRDTHLGQKAVFFLPRPV